MAGLARGVGFLNNFEARVQWVDGEAHPENQLGVIVYVVGKKSDVPIALE